ncbi:hypothetical protein HU200_009317 [Digitaria exilis]|uniref:PHD-type domain-containing protein n=1 Tax=Digitaria exilis TaxID=1010633 RepID=A0A835FKY1_9POAL|nr:hypothetical protein HU200_009317 [Digitaria exilis]
MVTLAPASHYAISTKLKSSSSRHDCSVRIASARSKQPSWLLISKMDGKDLFAEIGMREEDIAMMLFGKKVAELAEDTFDGSKEERQIFEGVFCLPSIDRLTDHRHEGIGHTADAGKAVTGSNTPSSSASNYKMGLCRIVESFTAGNLSSYHVFCHGSDQQVCRAMLSPHAGPSELVVKWTPPPPDRVYTRRATRRSERARLCSAMDLEGIDIRNFGRQRDGRGYGELWSHLRMHAHLLMVDAGWKIQSKPRSKSKVKVDHIYVAPDKRTQLFSLPRAWKCFGQWLLMTTPCTDGNESNDYGKEWSNMHDFVQDLKNTLMCLQYEVQRPNQSLSFLHQWRLLDPFMAVVCIDKKVAALKNGVTLKAMNSTVTFPSGSEGKLLNTKNESRALGSCKRSLLPRFLSETDIQPDKEGNSLLNEQSSIFFSSNPSECEANKKSLCVSNGRSIRSTAHRIVTGLHDTTAFLGSKQNCLSKKNKFPCIKSKVERQAPDKSDPLYFPPSYSSALDDLVENVQIEDLNFHGHETTEIPYAANSAGTPNEMLLGESLLFSPEVDEMLLGITTDVNNEHHDVAAVSDLQLADKDARNGLSDVSSLPRERNQYMGAKEDCIEFSRHDPAVVSQFEMADKDAGDRPSGSLSLQSENDMDLRANKMSLEDPTKTDQLSSEASGNALMISEPQVLFMSPEDGTLSFMNNSMNSQDMLSFLNASHDAMGTRSPVYEASLIQGFLYLDSQGSPICWTVTNREPPRQLICAADVEPSSELSKKYGEVNFQNEASAYGHKEMLESGSSKKGEKRPNKIADIQDCFSRKKHKVNGAPLSNCESQYIQPKNKDGKDQDEQIEYSKQLMPEEPIKQDDKKQKKTWSRTCKFDDDDLLMTAVIDKLTARYRNRFHRTNKIGFRRLPRYRWKREDEGGRKKFIGGARTVLNKLLEMGIVARVKSYSLCQLQAWSIEQKVRKERAKGTMSLQGDQNDDICGSCGDVGELICCDNCPASYHQACLPCQDIPDGNWYCSMCLCDICGEVINSKELRTSVPALECLQCERQYHAKCIGGKVLRNEKGGTDSFLCGKICQQLLKSLKVEMLLLSAIPQLVDTWTSTFGFREIDDSDKKKLSKVSMERRYSSPEDLRDLPAADQSPEVSAPDCVIQSLVNKLDALKIASPSATAGGVGTECNCDEHSVTIAFVGGQPKDVVVVDGGLCRIEA